MQKQLKLERIFKHPAKKIWNAISKADEIGKWFLKADFKVEVGYNYTFTHEDTKIRGEVLEVDEPTKLVYTWEVEGSGVASTVTWMLEEKGDETELIIEHISEGDADENPAINPMFMEFQKDWENVYNELEKYLK
jgi:uncharacterized protein YndB with AHSA1/START domain